jgi:hypothetical protein
VDVIDTGSARSTTRASATSRALLVAVALLVVLVLVLLAQVLGLRADVRSLQSRLRVPPAAAARVDPVALGDVCRLLGALAGAHGVDQARAFSGRPLADCERRAGEAARATDETGAVRRDVTVVNDLPATQRVAYCVPARECTSGPVRTLPPGGTSTFAVRQAADEKFVRFEVRGSGRARCILVTLAGGGRPAPAAATSDAQPDLC